MDQLILSSISRSLRHATLLKKRLWHRCFPANFVKISKNTFLTEHLRTTAPASLQKPKPFFTNREKSVSHSRDQTRKYGTWYMVSENHHSSICIWMFTARIECSLLTQGNTYLNPLKKMPLLVHIFNALHDIIFIWYCITSSRL